MNGLSEGGRGGKREESRKWWVLASAALAFFLVILDTTAANVALHSIGLDLHADISGQQWVIDGYNLVFAALLLSAGALGDRIGNRRVFIVGFALFAVASALAAAAPTLHILILACILQGAGGALMIPASLSVVRHTFLNEFQLARAVAIWVISGGVALAAGPLVGGLLVGSLGWRSIFWLNVPLGLAGIFLAWKNVRSPASGGVLWVNLPAQITGALAMGGAAFALIEGHRQGWLAPAVLTALAVGFLAFLAFLYAEFTNKHPIVPRHLYSHGQYVAVVCIGFVTNYSFYGLVFLLSLYFPEILHRSPLHTGLAFLPMTGATLLANLISGRLNAYSGPRRPLVIGHLLLLSGLAALPFISNSSDLPLATVMALIGAGTGFIVPSITAAALDSVPRESSGIAAAILQTARQIGGVFGVAVFGAALALPSHFQGAFQLTALTSTLAVATTLALSLTLIKPRPSSPSPSP